MICGIAIMGLNGCGKSTLAHAMAVSYKRLWKLLVDKEMSKSDLRKKAGIAPNTMTKLRRDEEVSLTILSKICKTLNADFGDIVEYVPDAEIWDLYDENRELLGRDHVRGEQLPIDGYHLVVHVWIRNSKGEYLISQRSANRPTHPLMLICLWRRWNTAKGIRGISVFLKLFQLINFKKISAFNEQFSQCLAWRTLTHRFGVV